MTISDDGSRVVYVRRGGPGHGGDQFWSVEVSTGAERPLAELPAGTSVDGYACDAHCRTVTYVSEGRLYRVRDTRTDDSGGPAGAVSVERLPTTGGPEHVTPDPTGRRVAYHASGALRVIDEHGHDELLAGEAGIVWGAADPVSTEVFGRERGYWWSPDGERVLATRTAGADPHRAQGDPHRAGACAATSLHLLDLDGFWVDVRWDRQVYPHLAAVTWEPRSGPLIVVLPRDQHHALVLAVDPRTGETQVHAELDDPRWVTVTPGTPRYLPDGRVVLGGELSLDAVDARCLFGDGTLLTPHHLYVHRLRGSTAVPAESSGPQPVELVIEASDGEPSERHVYRVRLAGRLGTTEVTRLTTTPGWHTATTAGGTVVVASESLDHAGVRTVVHSAAGSHEFGPPPGPDPGVSSATPRPALTRVTDRRLPSAVLYPAGHVSGRRLPVLLTVTGGPAGQGVLAAREAWWRHQWYADQGFGVVVVDGRGSPGVSPGFEKAIYRRLLDIMLTDQSDGLSAVGAKHPDLDPERVAVYGEGLGGSVALAAVLRAPEVFRAAVAVAPVTDWTAEPAGYAERYLGPFRDNQEAYQRHDLVAAAPELTRPVLLVRAGGDARATQFDRLVTALRDAGRPHDVLSGVQDRSVVAFLHRTLGEGT